MAGGQAARKKARSTVGQAMTIPLRSHLILRYSRWVICGSWGVRDAIDEFCNDKEEGDHEKDSDVAGRFSSETPLRYCC